MSGDKSKLPKQIVEHIINNSPFLARIRYARPMEMSSSSRYTLPPRKDREQKKGE